MRKLFYVSIILLFTSCLNLDANMFDADNSISAYLWDEFQQEGEAVIGDEFTVDPDEQYLFTLKSEYDGTSEDIYALYLGNIGDLNKDTVIVYCHGNFGHMDIYWERAKLLYYTGGKSHYGVLMMDYRGFGLSGGNVEEASLIPDVQACIDWLKLHGLTDDRMIIYGFSLGSVPAIGMCVNGKNDPAKLILEAPIGNVDAMVQGSSSISMPASYVVGLEFDNIASIRSVQQDLLLIHGLADSFLPYNTHGQPVYDNHPGENKEKVLVTGGEHGNTPHMMGVYDYMDRLEAFIKSK
jgi:pimeloyl-ACP methyl ester carboxylesterase